MAILLQDEIRSLANDPTKRLLGTDFVDANIESCSYDLRIGAVFKQGEIYSNSINQAANWNIEVKPSEIVTILTLEEINLPPNIVGTVFAINSLSSTGFLILNPGHIDPGYKGPISICAINLSKSTIKLHYGRKIFTIIFDSLQRDAVSYNKNLVFSTRAEREQNFYREKASRLSNSFFDLIMENEYTPYLENLIAKGIQSKVNQVRKWIVNGIVFIGVIAGIVAAIIPFIPSTSDREKELTKELQFKNDTIRNLKKQLLLPSRNKPDTLNRNKDAATKIK